MRKRGLYILLFVLPTLVAACANPGSPTGGPVDQTPPSIVTSDPAINAVNVRPDRVFVTFSEYITESSLARALTVTPTPERPPQIIWHGRRLELRFREPLRENTTYIINFDTNLRDLNGVALAKPITIAFSTGPVINKGRLGGRVIDPLTGAPISGVDVYAYSVQDSTGLARIPDQPEYRTQTDAQGQFSFNYIGEQQYFVFAITDRNRNRRPDPIEAFAAPPRPTLLADTAGTATGTWPIAVLDTIRPTLQRIRTLSSRRVELRFSEGVRLDSAGVRWALTDSTTGQPRPDPIVYMRQDMPREIFVQTDSLTPGTYRLALSAVRDSAGNALSTASAGFRLAAAARDTTRLRVLRFGPEPPATAGQPIQIIPGRAPSVSFTRPLTRAQFTAAVQVADTAGTTIPFADSTSDGTTYRLYPTPHRTGDLVVRVDERTLGGRDTTFTQRYLILSERELGELGGVVTAHDAGPVVIEVYQSGAGRRPPIRTVRIQEPGRFTVRGLPVGTYRLRTFGDRNDNGRWDGGMLVPYRRPESLAWSADSVRVRARWENVLGDTLRLLSP